MVVTRSARHRKDTLAFEQVLVGHYQSDGCWWYLLGWFKPVFMGPYAQTMYFSLRQLLQLLLFGPTTAYNSRTRTTDVIGDDNRIKHFVHLRRLLLIDQPLINVTQMLMRPCTPWPTPGPVRQSVSVITQYRPNRSAALLDV